MNKNIVLRCPPLPQWYSPFSKLREAFGSNKNERYFLPSILVQALQPAPADRCSVVKPSTLEPIHAGLCLCACAQLWTAAVVYSHTLTLHIYSSLGSSAFVTTLSCRSYSLSSSFLRTCSCLVLMCIAALNSSPCSRRSENYGWIRVSMFSVCHNIASGLALERLCACLRAAIPEQCCGNCVHSLFGVSIVCMRELVSFRPLSISFIHQQRRASENMLPMALCNVSQ